MPTIRQTVTFADRFAGLRDIRAKARINTRIRRLSLGDPGDSRNLAGGVSELRVDSGPGYRVYHTRRGAEIVILLCGGDKRTRQQDIDQPLKLAREE